MAAVEVNWLAVLVAAIVAFVLGGLWYGLLFARSWMAAMDVTAAQMKARGHRGAWVGYVASFVGSIVVASGLNSIMDLADWTTPVMGAAAGVTAAIGFGAASSLPSAIFEGKKLALWYINTGLNVVTWAAMGVIVAVWP